MNKNILYLIYYLIYFLYILQFSFSEKITFDYIPKFDDTDTIELYYLTNNDQYISINDMKMKRFNTGLGFRIRTVDDDDEDIFSLSYIPILSSCSYFPCFDNSGDIYWENEANFNSTSYISTKDWDNSLYLSSFNGVVFNTIIEYLEKYINKYPFWLPLEIDNYDNNEQLLNGIITSKDDNLVWNIFYELSYLGVSLKPILPPKRMKTVCYSKNEDYEKLDVSSDSTLKSDINKYYINLYNCIYNNFKSLTPTSSPTLSPTITPTTSSPSLSPTSSSNNSNRNLLFKEEYILTQEDFMDQLNICLSESSTSYIYMYSGNDIYYKFDLYDKNNACNIFEYEEPIPDAKINPWAENSWEDWVVAFLLLFIFLLGITLALRRTQLCLILISSLNNCISKIYFRLFNIDDRMYKDDGSGVGLRRGDHFSLILDDSDGESNQVHAQLIPLEDQSIWNRDNR